MRDAGSEVVVLDASIAVALLLEEPIPVTQGTLKQLEWAPALVPLLWHYETRNALLVAERRGRLSGADTASRLRALAEIRTTTDNEPNLERALIQAREHGLSYYDALYLELAERRSAPLATLDRKLLGAARATGIPDRR